MSEATKTEAITFVVYTWPITTAERDKLARKLEEQLYRSPGVDFVETTTEEDD